MKSEKVLAFFISFLLCSQPFSLQAHWVWSPEAGKFINTESVGQDTADEQYDYALKLYKEKKLEASAEQLEDLLKKFPQSRIASEAQYRIGLIWEERQDYNKAFKAYKVLVEQYLQSERFAEVIEREFRIGNLFLAGQKAKLLGLEVLPSLPRAVEVFEHIVKNAPYSAYGDKAQFHLGLSYKKWGQFAKAVEAFQALIDQYPDSELASQARYQMAEVSFMRSASENRDQRALDEASKQVDSFLTRYPDSTVSENAAKLRQEIDEKNAEKNYRVGAYYERDNYIDSALIYYSDVAKRYPHTQWGEKAEERMKALQDPAKYLISQENEVGKQIEILQSKIKSGTVTDKFEQERLKRELERLEKRGKGVEKNKKNTLERRKDDLKRREYELKEKFKNLEKKKKLMKKNPSDDFRAAIERWNDSLVEEQEQLAKERQQLQGWREELGVEDKNLVNIDFLPFMGAAPTEIEKIRAIEAKKLYKLSEEKRSLLEEKETLYKQHGEVALLMAELGGGTGTRLLPATAGLSPGASPMLQAQHEKLIQVRADIERLELDLEEKQKTYEDKYGVSALAALVNAPGRVLASSTSAVAKSLDRSVDILNPFNEKAAPTRDMDMQQLLEHRMHLQEKIAAQESLTQTLSQAFDSELALQEQKRLLKSLEGSEKTDPRELRKAVKSAEREIRSRYEEIEDRHKRKKALLKELDNQLKDREAHQPAPVRAVHTVAAPAIGVVKFGKAFLFGLPDKGVELTQSAAIAAPDSAGDDVRSAQIKELKEAVELESLLIDAKHEEIMKYQRELEILKAKASLAGGLKFRSALVQVPYQFIGEAIQSARKVVPAKKRQELLISKLDEETRRLEAMKQQLAQVEAQVSGKPATKSSADKPAAEPVEREVKIEPVGEADKKNDTSGDESAKNSLKQEIELTASELKMQESVYREQRAALDNQIQTEALAAGKPIEASGKAGREWSVKEKKLHREMRGIEKEILELIKKENDLESDESTILEKRIMKIDKIIPKTQSKIVSQDLLSERERMEDRLSQLTLRRDFLMKERDRFQPSEKGAAA